MGGFKQNITEAKLTKGIEWRGPPVTKVTIFRNRKLRTLVHVIRINVEDNGNANLLVDDTYFCQQGVTCRPWLSMNAYTSRYNTQTDDYADKRSSRRGRYTYRYHNNNGQHNKLNRREHYNNRNYNPYSTLGEHCDEEHGY